MRLTIAIKIAATITTVVMLSIGTMAWITSQNLKRGFISYLGEVEQQDLKKLSRLLAESYQRDGNFDRFYHDRGNLRELLDQIHPGPRDNDRVDGTPPSDDALGSSIRIRPRSRNTPPDLMGFTQRLSLIDNHGNAIIGPRDAANARDGSRQPIVVGHQEVGSLILAPLQNISNTSGLDFVRVQIQQTMWLAVGLILTCVIARLNQWLFWRLWMMGLPRMWVEL